MSQSFDVTKPATGVTTFGTLYALLRANFEALNTCHSGTTAPGSPVAGQYFFNTSTGKLSVYNSGWKEVLVEDYGMGAELEAARGSHASLDARLDAQINEDGTLKAATTLNPSQWYDLSVASGWVSTTSFKALGANYTTVYYPTRRLKINQTGGTYYTEVVSSSYSAPDTTVITRDAVCGASAGVFRDVSHSIVGPRKAGAGDGAVSFEMVATMGTSIIGDAAHSQLIGDSVLFMAPTSARTLTLQDCATYGIGRPVFICNYGSAALTIAPAGANHIYPADANLTLYGGQSAILMCSGVNWHRIDMPSVMAWVSVSSFGAGWTGESVGYYKDPFGIVHLKGYITTASSASTMFTLPAGYRPDQSCNFLNGVVTGSPNYPVHIVISTGGLVTYSLGGVAMVAFLDGITFKAAT